MIFEVTKSGDFSFVLLALKIFTTKKVRNHYDSKIIISVFPNLFLMIITSNSDDCHQNESPLIQNESQELANRTLFISCH